MSSMYFQTVIKNVIPEFFFRNSNIWKPIVRLSNTNYVKESSPEQTDQIQNIDFGPYVASYLKTTTENFRINIDIKNYLPEELSIRMCDNIITIEGRHENGPLNTNVQHFLRRYHFSEGYDFDNAKSYMTLDGKLTIEMPKIDTTRQEDRIILIQRKHR